jgi:hypothetical protein
MPTQSSALAAGKSRRRAVACGHEASFVCSTLRNVPRARPRDLCNACRLGHHACPRPDDPAEHRHHPGRRHGLLRRRLLRRRDPDAEHRFARHQRRSLYAVLQQRVVLPVAGVAADRAVPAPGWHRHEHRRLHEMDARRREFAGVRRSAHGRRPDDGRPDARRRLSHDDDRQVAPWIPSRCVARAARVRPVVRAGGRSDELLGLGGGRQAGADGAERRDVRPAEGRVLRHRRLHRPGD